ncbi:MAG: hypothetical protein U0768_19750 [Anaerolineae bacterium]
MAKTRKQQAKHSRSGGGHLKVVCPQCGKRVNVPAQLAATQQAYPCPSCRVPISRAVIEAARTSAETEATDAAAAPTEEAVTAAAPTEEAAEPGAD